MNDTSRFCTLFSSFFFAACTFSGTVLAHEYKIGNIQVGHPYARPTVAAQSAGAAYLSLQNLGATADKLVDARSSELDAVEFHQMSMDGDVMKMRELDAVELAAKAKVVMQPGIGMHLMLIGLKKPLKVGDKLPVTLQFEKAGKLDVIINVEDAKADKSAHTMKH